MSSPSESGGAATGAPSAAGGLARNAAALFGSQAVGLVAPLLAVPFLARVLRPEGWAPVLAAQSLAVWLIMVLEYGFDLSGTRAVAHTRHTPQELPEVVRGVQSAKLMLLPLAVLIVGTAFVMVPVLSEHRELLPWTLAFAVVRGLNPFWYFQGVERVQRAAAVEALTRAFGVLGALVVVRGAADAWRVVALQAAFGAVSLVMLTVAMHRDIAWRGPSFHAGSRALRESWTIFATRAASGVYTQASTLIFGLVGSTLAVASFGGAERVVRAATGLLQPLTQVFLPRVSFLRASDPAMARQLIRRSFIGVGLLGATIGATALIGAPWIVRLLLGAGYEAAIPSMRMLAALPPLVAINTVLGLYWAVPFGHERAVLRTIVVAALAHIGLVLLLVPRWGAPGMCGAVVGAEVVVTIMLGSLFVRHRSD